MFVSAMRHFTESERQAFLEDLHIGVLSVAAPDGRPPASVPIWYEYTDGHILVTPACSIRRALRDVAPVVTRM